MSVQDELVQLTEALIRFKTVSGNNQAFTECRQFIIDYFRDTTLSVTEYEKDGAVSLLFSKHGTTTPKILLYGHIDVVGASDEAFEPKQEGDRLYGRGAMDMKSGLACLMKNMKDLADTDIDIGLLITPDEEIGGTKGTVHVLEQGLRADVVIMPDGGERVDHMVIKEKGVVRVLLEAKGVSSHGSRPWLGKDALKSIEDAIQKIRTLFVPVEHHEPHHWHSTFVVGTLRAGDAMNCVPDTATAGCDVRIAQPDTCLSVISKIKNILPSGVTMQVPFAEEGMHLEESHSYIGIYRDILASRGDTLTCIQTHCGSDARHFMKYSIPCIQTQPDGGNLHAPGEWVSLQGIATYYMTIRTFIERIA